MSDISKITGSLPSPSNALSTVDGVSIGGSGATLDPLHTITGGVSVISNGTSIAGNGTTGNPLRTVPGGTSVITDGTTITGNGTVGNPLHATGGSGTNPTALPDQWSAGLSANQTNTPLASLISGRMALQMIRTGSIAGMAVLLAGPITGGTLSVHVTVNGTPGTLVYNAGIGGTGGEETQAAGIDTYSAGDAIGLCYSTSADFTPVGEGGISILVAWLEVIEEI